MKEYLFLLLFLLILIPVVNAQVETLGTAKVNNCIMLVQTYSNSTYTNLTRIQYPDKTIQYFNIAFDKYGADYNYSFCDTSQLGEYIASMCTDVDGINTCISYDFIITPNGSEQTTSQSLGSMAFLLMVIVLTLIFGYIGYKFLDNDLLWPLGFFFIVMCFLFLIYDVWLLVEFKTNYTGSSPDAGMTQTIFYIFMTILSAGFMTACVLLFTKWKVIKDKFKSAIKPEEEDKDELI
jgi:hypothetical protein